MPENDVGLLESAARQAGEIARTYFQRDPHVTDKPGGAGPVTVADLAVNAMLENALQSARPDYGWLSEETEDSTARLGTTRQFVVDPIDGTRAFIDGSKDWAHSLAVVENGRPVAAAVYLPMHDMMFTASRTGGARLNGRDVRVSSPARLEDAVVLGARPNFEGRFWRDGTPPPVKRAFRSSLAYRLCLVAQGRFDGMITLRPSWEWDIAAGALIAAEAGAVVTDPFGKALRFNNAEPKVPGVLLGGALLHQALAARLETEPAKP